MRTFWHTFSRDTRIAIIVIGVMLILIRLAMPYVVKSYVNKKLDQLADYDGRMEDIQIHLIRGAYSIKRLEIVKTTAQISEPFFSAENVDFSIQWRELFRGALVGEIYIEKAKLNFIKGSTSAQSQTKIQHGWLNIVEDLFPFQINHLVIRQSEIWYKDLNFKPAIDLYVNHLFAVADNLTNSRDITKKLPARLRVRAHTLGDGILTFNIKLNPFSKTPTFDIDAEIKKINLVSLNSFLKAYAKVDVNRGKLGVYIELAAADGKVEGYIKPLIEDLDIIELKQEKNPLDLFWEIIVSGLSQIFKNHQKDRLGTKIPISGSVSNTEVHPWPAIGNLFKNAFIKVLQPNVERKISLEDAENAKTS